MARRKDNRKSFWNGREIPIDEDMERRRCDESDAYAVHTREIMEGEM